MSTQPDMGYTARQARKWGPLTGPARISGCLIDLLATALPAYLDEAAFQDSEPVRVERPASYSRRPLGEELAEQHLPRIIVLPGATVGNAERTGDGHLTVTWELSAGAVVAGDNDDDGLSADLMADTYGLAITATLLQLGCLAHDQIRDIRWTGSPGMATRIGGQQGQRRWLTAVEHRFEIDIEGVLWDLAGPGSLEELPTDPGTGPVDPGNTVPVEHVEIAVDAVAPGEDVA